MGRSPGGRTSQRRETVSVSGQEVQLKFDHGAQYFTVSDHTLFPILEKWLAAGVVAEWKGRIGRLNALTGEVTPEEKQQSDVQEAGAGHVTNTKKRWVGVPGMNSMCQAMAAHPGVTVRSGIQVARASLRQSLLQGQMSTAGVRDGNRVWFLEGSDGRPLGTYEALIIAASYKTARVEVDNLPEINQALHSVKANPCFATMVAFASAAEKLPLDGVSVEGSDVLVWASRDSSKPKRASDSESTECWVLHSSASYAEKKITEAAARGQAKEALLDEVARDMVASFQALVSNSPPVLFARAHRWGGAFPVEGPEGLVAVDVLHHVAACGDFFRGPLSARVQGAMASGLAAAEAIASLLMSPSL
eukprot:TRINITY_DN941_c0_g1_i3.p1 TRINITY_DN941_c0_g1~~TRINITY_DN941_c0_g1_i3.p1  ORF type:complete len:361 (+),score=110.74 TRINITY_DN941_c0_g1_i3:135-1217(+)